MYPVCVCVRIAKVTFVLTAQRAALMNDPSRRCRVIYTIEYDYSDTYKYQNTHNPSSGESLTT